MEMTLPEDTAVRAKKWGFRRSLGFATLLDLHGTDLHVRSAREQPAFFRR